MIFGTGGDYSHVGIGGKFSCNVTGRIRLAGEFDFFPEKDYFSWWDFSVYGNYLFPLSDRVAFYPSVGLGMTGIKMDMDFGFLGKVSDSTSGFVTSIGGGFDFELTPSLILNLELRYKFIDFGDIGVSGNRTHLGAGITYRF
jgi:opacity protein-like surface antigen